MATCCEHVYSIPDCLLPHRCDIHACDIVKAAAGGGQRKYPPEGGRVKHSDVHCLFEPLDAGKVLELLHQNIRATHRVYFDRDLGLDLTDRLSFGGRFFENKGTLDIAELGAVFVTNCEEVKK